MNPSSGYYRMSLTLLQHHIGLPEVRAGCDIFLLEKWLFYLFMIWSELLPTSHKSELYYYSQIINFSGWTWFFSRWFFYCVTPRKNITRKRTRAIMAIARRKTIGKMIPRSIRITQTIQMLKLLRLSQGIFLRGIRIILYDSYCMSHTYYDWYNWLDKIQ